MEAPAQEAGVPEGALAADDFTDTPEDRPEGPAAQQQQSQQPQQQAAAGKGAAQASLRLRPLGGAGEQA